MVPVALAVVGDVYPERTAGAALGTLGAIETIGWVWGPLYGAMLVRLLRGSGSSGSTSRSRDRRHGRVVVGARRPRPARHGARIDWVGAVLLDGHARVAEPRAARLGRDPERQRARRADRRRAAPTCAGCTRLRSSPAIAFVWHAAHSPTTRSSTARAVPRPQPPRSRCSSTSSSAPALVIAMVDVPLFINAVEVDLERSAVIAGWVLSALTAAMAVASYVGGRLTERTWYGPPVLLGLALATVAYACDGAHVGRRHLLRRSSPSSSRCSAPASASPSRRRLAPSSTRPGRPAWRGGRARDGRPPARLQRRAVGAHGVGPGPLQRSARDIDLPPITDPGFESALRAAPGDADRHGDRRDVPRPPSSRPSA